LTEREGCQAYGVDAVLEGYAGTGGGGSDDGPWRMRYVPYPLRRLSGPTTPASRIRMPAWTRLWGDSTSLSTERIWRGYLLKLPCSPSLIRSRSSDALDPSLETEHDMTRLYFPVTFRATPRNRALLKLTDRPDSYDSTYRAGATGASGVDFSAQEG